MYIRTFSKKIMYIRISRRKGKVQRAVPVRGLTTGEGEKAVTISSCWRVGPHWRGVRQAVFRYGVRAWNRGYKPVVTVFAVMQWITQTLKSILSLFFPKSNSAFPGYRRILSWIVTLWLSFFFFVFPFQCMFNRKGNRCRTGTTNHEISNCPNLMGRRK